MQEETRTANNRPSKETNAIDVHKFSEVFEQKRMKTRKVIPGSNRNDKRLVSILLSVFEKKINHGHIKLQKYFWA